MTIELLRSFFLWCTVLNASLLILSFAVLMYASDWVYGMHGRWFNLSRSTFNVVVYAFVGAMEIIVLMFNLIPYIALSIIRTGPPMY
jgi:hypothetical protein